MDLEIYIHILQEGGIDPYHIDTKKKRKYPVAHYNILSSSLPQIPIMYSEFYKTQSAEWWTSIQVLSSIQS